MRKPGAFSCIIASRFANVHAYISLMNTDTYEVIADEKNHLLDEVEDDRMHLERMGDISYLHRSTEPDHLSILEVANLPKGNYHI